MLQIEKNKKYVFIKNFSTSLEEVEILKVIQTHHLAPVSVSITRDAQTKESRGFGFVGFSTLFEANKFIQLCEQEKILLEGCPLYGNLYKTKEERQKEKDEKERIQIQK